MASGVIHPKFDLQKRTTEIKRGIDQFNSYNSHLHLVIDPDAHLKIGGIYEHILLRDVKPLVPKNVNKFKMGSVTALVTNKEQPFQIGGQILDKKQRRIINAELSFYLAMNLILDMANPHGYETDTGIASIDDSVVEIKKQHINWLKAKKLEVFPIFPVASFYYCFFVLYQNRYNAIMT